MVLVLGSDLTQCPPLLHGRDEPSARKQPARLILVGAEETMAPVGSSQRSDLRRPGRGGGTDQESSKPKPRLDVSERALCLVNYYFVSLLVHVDVRQK